MAQVMCPTTPHPITECCGAARDSLIPSPGQGTFILYLGVCGARSAVSKAPTCFPVQKSIQHHPPQAVHVLNEKKSPPFFIFFCPIIPFLSCLNQRHQAMLLVPHRLTHLDWSLSGFPCVKPQPLHLENTQSSTLGWDSGAWPWPPLLFQHIRAAKAPRTHLRTRRKLGRSTQAISAGTGGQYCCV